MASKFFRQSLVADDTDGTECLTVADVGDIVMPDYTSVAEDACRQTHREEPAEMLVSSNTGPSLQLHTQLTVTPDTNTAPQSLAVSAAISPEVCRPCNDAQTSGSEGNQLVPLELYIQGNSQTVFLLFMQQGSLSELDVVKDLVGILCSLG